MKTSKYPSSRQRPGLVYNANTTGRQTGLRFSLASKSKNGEEIIAKFNEIGGLKFFFVRNCVESDLLVS